MALEDIVKEAGWTKVRPASRPVKGKAVEENDEGAAGNQPIITDRFKSPPRGADFGCPLDISGNRERIQWAALVQYISTARHPKNKNSNTVRIIASAHFSSSFVPNDSI